MMSGDFHNESVLADLCRFMKSNVAYHVTMLNLIKEVLLSRIRKGKVSVFIVIKGSNKFLLSCICIICSKMHSDGFTMHRVTADYKQYCRTTANSHSTHWAPQFTLVRCLYNIWPTNKTSHSVKAAYLKYYGRYHEEMGKL